MPPGEPASHDAPSDPSAADPVRSWIGGPIVQRGEPHVESSEGARLSSASIAAVWRAARYAEHAYPGPIGDLIGQELRTYAANGVKLPPHAIGPRLASMLITQEKRHPLPPLPSYAHLPAQHAPGTGSRWRYRSVIDVEEPDTGKT